MKKLLQSMLVGITFFSGIALANIPEPDVVFYGKVSVQVGDIKLGLYEGDLNWVIKHRESGMDEQYSFSTNLEAIETNSDGKYSYKIQVPQQLLVNIETMSDQPQGAFLTQSAKELLLKHYQININGKPALLDDSDLWDFRAGETFRSNHHRLDLTVPIDSLGELADQDKDGLPDIWEMHYGLQVSIKDINNDADNDGWTDEDEYIQGTNPIVNNRKPLLKGENGNSDTPQVTLYENGITQLRLSMYDSDSMPEDLLVTLESIPEGLEIFREEDMSDALVEGDSLRLAYAGEYLLFDRLFAKYKPDGLSDTNGVTEPGPIKLAIMDNGPHHNADEPPLTEQNCYDDDGNVKEGPCSDCLDEGVFYEWLCPTSVSAQEPNEFQTVSVKLNVFRPSKVADPVRWIDGMAYRGQSINKLPGRSSNPSDALAAYGYTERGEFNWLDVKINISNEGMIQLNGHEDLVKNRSAMLAFQEPEYDGFSLGLGEPGVGGSSLDLSGDRSIFAVYQAAEGAGDNKLFNDGEIDLVDDGVQLMFGKTSSRKHIATSVLGQNGLKIAAVHTQAGGSYLEYDGVQAGGPVELETEKTHEASSLAGFGFASGAWGENQGYAAPFNGQVGEFIAFPRTIEGMDKWVMNAYMLSKWKGYSVIDASDSSIPAYLEASGNPGRSVMLGGVGDDELTSGNSANAVMFGGAGSDILTGGDGKDRFVVTDGDIVVNFKEYYESARDVIDLTELLPLGSTPIENCLFFTPLGNETKVTINADCEGKDFVSGSDFTDAEFTIKGQSLWNTDIPILWSSGALFAGSHRPGKLQASLSTQGGVQEVKLNENDSNDGELRSPVTLSFQGGRAFQGKNLLLPMVVKGSAELNDYYITARVPRQINEENQPLIEKITQSKYSTVKGLMDLTMEQLKEFRITRDESGRLYHYYNLLLDAVDFEGDKIIYLSSDLVENTDTSSQIGLYLVVKQDSKKETEETVVLQLEHIPEYYDLLPNRDKLTVTIADGLDKVYASNTRATVLEGEQSQFTLHRKGSIDQPLVVDINLSGLAENGRDYSTISSQLTFAKNEDTLVVPVHVLSDETSESMELIELRVLSSDRYDVDTERNLAQLTLQDEALNFVDTDKDGLPDSWEIAVGLNPNISNHQNDDFLDSDQDGLSDQDEYWLGTNPMKIDSDGDGVVDGQDAGPMDSEVKDANLLKGYQIVRAGHKNDIRVPLEVDRLIDIPLEYLTSDGSDQANGLQLVLKYNADQLEYQGIDSVLPISHASTGSPNPKEVYRGGYKLFTHEVSVTWDASGNDWPSIPLPAKLLNAQFKILSGAAVGQKFIIGVDAKSATDGYAFKPSQVAVNVVAPANMDILINQQDVSAEAVMLARHFAGLSPEAPELMSDVESKLSADEVDRINQHISDAGLLYDVDGDGIVNPLSDAVLIYHYLKNASSDENSDGALSDQQVKEVLGVGTSVTAASVNARILGIQGGGS